MNSPSESPLLNVLFENEDLIAVDKPVGQTVIPARNQKDILPPLVEMVSKKIGKKANVVHRLDQDTSGIVVFGKNAQTHRELCLLWEKREVVKLYKALVWGKVSSGEGIIDHPLRPFGSGRMGVDPNGKKSQTRYRLLQRGTGSSLLEVEPWTGRRHQIRVHFYHLGFPVMGDPLYGQERPVGGVSRLMLHAYQLVIPLRGQTLTINCEPGKDFVKILNENTEMK